MANNSKKIASIILGILILLSLVAFGFYYGGGHEIIKGDKKVPNNLDYLMIWTYVLIGLTVLSTLIFGVYNLVMSFITNPKKAILSVISLIALLGLLAVAYILGDGSGTYGVNNDKLPKLLMDATTWIKVTDMWIYATYVLLGLNVVAVLAGFVKQAIQRYILK